MAPETASPDAPPASVPGFSKLQASALRLFAVKGYDGAHVSDIARGAGIRKSSVYAHCRSKEDLFIGLLRQVMQREFRILSARLVEGGLLAGLRNYYGSFRERLEEDPPCLRFLLRSVYTPPADMREAVFALGREFFPGVRELFKGAAAERGVRPENVDSLAEACLAVTDSVLVACLYCAHRVDARLEAVWLMFERHVAAS
ncbi:MAG: TetR/AcrR family transcriptional regulator [Deltaproteobacteria bacterium]|jgi:AcrR family transcriptional regulator|nr:TetR/AcrR family transcriptional regulator [Deltaproteobacteria bacterium]